MLSKAPILKEWLLKDENIIQESYREKDLLDWETEISSYCNKLNSLNLTWIIWFIWPFWCWKTTFLNQVADKIGWKWIKFEAWQYPDRKDLRENFILEIANNFWDSLYEKYKDKINGKKWKNVKKVLKWSSTLTWLLWGLLSNFEPLTWWLISVWSQFLKEVENYFNNHQLTKVYEFQELLRDLLNYILEENKKIYIIIEDIDRSWKDWIYFLETLNYFLNKYFQNKNIIVIAPISDESFNNNKQAYLKALDYYDIFPVISYNFCKFVDEIFSDEVLSFEWFRENLLSLLKWIFENFYDQLNLRFLKTIIRSINKEYLALISWEDNKWLDFRFFIIFWLSKHFKSLNHNTGTQVVIFHQNWETPFENWYNVFPTCFHEEIIKLIKLYEKTLEFYWIVFEKSDELYLVKDSISHTRTKKSVYFNSKYMNKTLYTDVLYLSN